MLELKSVVRRDRGKDPIELAGLRPDFIPASHRSYVEILERELDRKDPPRNVALAGPYGSGKSSILVELRKRRQKHGVVEIGLATIDGSTTAISRQRTHSESDVQDAVTDGLQKEIVKRLLYSAKSARLPRSQLNRIRTLDWRTAVWVAVGGAIALGGLAWIYAIPGPFSRLAEDLSPTTGSLTPAVWASGARVLDAVLVFVVLLFGQWALSHVRLREVAVGEFRLTREDPGQNYFDQYLDEIVYFFARTKTRLVIFEDLDRFADKGIFISLRELNVLLNNSAAIPEPVTFVYAVRDSVFSRGGGSRGGVSGAASDRAKFFDLIVPVVPFVSTEVSGGLLATELRTLPDGDRPADALVALAGQHFPDMRVLRTIRNEYRLYFDRLIRHGIVQLDHDRLFAILLYKQAFPKDFERVQFGTSRIDRMFSELDGDVAIRLAGLDHEISVLESNLAAELAVTDRAAEAGARLLGILNLLASRKGSRGALAQVTLGSVAYQPEDLSDASFWKRLDQDPTGDIVCTFADGTTAVAVRSAIDSVLSEDIPANAWIESVQTAGAEHLGRIRATRQDLRHANLRQRLTDTRFAGFGVTAGSASVEVDLEATGRRILRHDFAFDLARSGYIDSDYPLYTSVYQGALVSAAAQTYRVQFVGRRKPAPLYILSASDVREIRAKIGDRFLEEPSGLNVSIFDHLLGTDALDRTITAMASDESLASREFAALYLANGLQQELLINTLAPRSSWILELIATDGELSEAVRQRYFGAVLGALQSDIEYTTNRDVYRLVDVLTRASFKDVGQHLKGSAAKVVAKLVADAGAQVPRLSLLSHDARRAIGDNGRFAMTRENLAALAGAKGKVGLDSIGRRSRLALRQVLDRLPAYLDVLDGRGKPSGVDSPQELGALLPILAEYGPRATEAVLKRTGENVMLSVLPRGEDAAPEEIRATFPTLARTASFSPTTSNLIAYMDVVGGIDQALEGYIATFANRVEVEQVSIEDHRRLCQAIVSSSIPVRSLLALIKRLAEREPLDVGRISVSRPQVASALMRQHLIPDDVVSFTAMRAWPWLAREEAFLRSRQVGSFIADLPLSSADVRRILKSDRLGPGLKQALIEAPNLVALVSEGQDADAVLTFTNDEVPRLTAEQLVALKSVGASDELIAKRLGGAPDHFTDQDVLTVLIRLSGDWPLLARQSNRWRLFPTSDELDSLLLRLERIGTVRRTSRTIDGRTRVTLRDR